MKLSVIIPVYNVDKYVAQCLDSVLDQNFEFNDYEIIVVNDGSTDGSLAIVQDYANKHKHIKLIDKKNGGVGSARNCGMDHAQGTYIYFIDSDDYLIPNSLNVLVDTCERHKLDVLTFLFTMFSSESSDDERALDHINLEDFVNDQMLSLIVSGEEYMAYYPYRNESCFHLTNREYAKRLELRYLEGHFLEDAEFNVRTFLGAERIAHLKFNAYRYRKNPESILNKKEPGHYLKFIRDMQSAAKDFEPIVKSLEHKTINPDCVARVKSIQQAIVFFSMIRMFKSTMAFEEVKLRMREMRAINAYPLDSLLGKDYNGLKYQILVYLLKTERRFYFFFKILNPILKRQ